MTESMLDLQIGLLSILHTTLLLNNSPNTELKGKEALKNSPSKHAVVTRRTSWIPHDSENTHVLPPDKESNMRIII